MSRIRERNPKRQKVGGMLLGIFMNGDENSKMELIDEILSKDNLWKAVKQVKLNKGAPGVDKMSVKELDEYFEKHMDEIIQMVKTRKYKPQPVKRVYIPKPNGKKRPLGIPTVIDRVIQQAVSQVLMKIFDPTFSNHSYGFRPNRSAHGAITEVLTNLNDGYEWVIDLDIEKYFDTVNHDKLISSLRERVKDSDTLHLIRLFLKAGVMEGGLVSQNVKGVPQGGPLSPLLSNIYLDKLDKELEARGLRFVRYADDANIFVRSEMAANRVMKSIVSWIERKLFLKVSAEKTKVVRPMKSKFIGFEFFKNSKYWQCKPSKDSKKRLCAKIKELLKRKRAVATPIRHLFKKLNEVIRGWINYYKIGNMKKFLGEFGEWMRHKVRVVIIKQWKRPRTIFKNLTKLNKILKTGFTEGDIYKCANTRIGWYKRTSYDIVNYLLSPKVLSKEKENQPGLVNPLDYYLSKIVN